ncbi:MAG TPA: hypothetical protein VGB50_07810 [Flavobacterium sp.]|jgi:hypothetical protein
MLHEFSYDEIKFGIAFPPEISGGGWDNDLEKIIKSNLKPEKFERIDKEINWDYSEVSFIILKEGIQFMLEIDKWDDISLILLEEPIEEYKGKLREWAAIIVKEALKQWKEK